MFLSKKEERILEGEEGEAARLAMRTIVKVGEALGASRLVEIEHAHVSGVSYLNIGDPGLEFIEHLANLDARIRVFGTINPLSFDLDSPHEFNITVEEYEKQLRIINALKKMGFNPTFTCTPYYIRKPSLGEHLAWGESSAVAYVNIVYGARTNKEGGPIALLSAIIGRIYYSGLHLTENRIPRVYFKTTFNTSNTVEAGLLGYIIGKLSKGRTAYLENNIQWKESWVKAYAAAIGTTSDNPLTIIENVSPETNLFNKEYIEDKITITREDLEEAYNELVDNSSQEQVVFFGCPHLGLEELRELVLTTKGYDKPVIVSTSRYIYAKAVEENLVKKLEEKGIKIIKDTCPIVSRLFKPNTTVKTNSTKASFYLKRLRKVKTILSDYGETGG